VVGEAEDFMSEDEIVERAQRALDDAGVDDTLVAAGEFSPRGRTGASIVGGLAGSEAGSVVGGGFGDALGLVAGDAAGGHAADAASGMPAYVVVAVSRTTVYGLAGRRNHPSHEILFQIPRADIDVEVHQRVNVRVLELIQRSTGDRIELEGNRLPVTHSKDVIDHLR
jgi:hypothetical protein